MNQGDQKPAIIVEPLADPFRRDPAPSPAPQRVPAAPVTEPEKVPA